MRHFFQKNAKILFVCFLILFTCTACSSPRAKDGRTKVDQIIASETVQIKKSEVNTTEISNQKLKKKYAKLDDNDMITIQPTSFSEAFDNGWFEGLIVWPLAQLINKVSASTDAGIGILVVTVLIQLLVFALTGKSQMASQRMQEIQPEFQAIQNKYRGRTDEASQMKMYRETQALYQKYDIHPFGTILITFIQLPIMMGMYYATIRSYNVLVGSFMGVNLSTTPMEGIQSLNVAIIAIYVLMVVAQLVSFRLPTWLKKRQEEKDHVKKHEYRQENKENNMQSSMNMYMYTMTIMFAFIYLNWPTAMSFYWCVTSLFRIIQNIILHHAMNKVKTA